MSAGRGRIEPASVSAALIEYVDFLPTFVSAAGGEPAAVLQGSSLLPVLVGDKKRHKDYVYGEMTTRGIINGSPYFGIRSVRSDKFKYIVNFTPDVVFTNACTNSAAFKSWKRLADAGNTDAADKVSRYHNRPAEELYALSDDPYEWQNLADDPKFAEIKSELRGKLDAWDVRARRQRAGNGTCRLGASSSKPEEEGRWPPRRGERKRRLLNECNEAETAATFAPSIHRRTRGRSCWLPTRCMTCLGLSHQEPPR